MVVRKSRFGRVNTIMLWIFLALSVVLILGSIVILLRTANIPKIPTSIKPKPYKDDENLDE